MGAVWVYNVDTTLLRGVDLIGLLIIVCVLSCTRMLCLSYTYAHSPALSIYTPTFSTATIYSHTHALTLPGTQTQEKKRVKL